MVYRRNTQQERILLMLLPYWAPLIPPLGISCLKSYLAPQGYAVRTIDANMEPQLWEMHHIYLQVLEKGIPVEKQGNLYMTGYDVFMNHLSAHLHFTDEAEYLELMSAVVAENFFIVPEAGLIGRLNDVAAEFFRRLEIYLEGVLAEERPDIFGLSVYSVSLAASLFAFKYVKSKMPHVKTVMGGGVFADQLAVDAPDFQGFLEKTPYIDHVFVGEGEQLFLKWLQGDLPQQRVYTLNDINRRLVDLSTLDNPDFSDFDVKKYTQAAGFGSRSCPFQCSFCSETVQWGAYRKKGAVQLVRELCDLSDRYGNRLFLLGDSLVNPMVDQLAREFIKSGREIYWDGYLRADAPVCDPVNTMLWRKGGYYRARLGIESGSQHVLDLMNKKITPDQIMDALAALAGAGIKTTTYWVIGHPGEREEDFLETLDLIEECRDDIYEVDWHPFYFFPTGQVNSKSWREENGIRELYPPSARDLLLTRTWVLDTPPSRAEVFDRMCRFGKHCKDLGIPNPYSLRDIHHADQRWSRLHNNAVPPLTAL